MRKLDRRGTAALEFALVAVPLFTLMFVIFDLGRYAITAQSLRMLANAEARAVMIKCYTPDVTAPTKLSPAGCTSDEMLTADKQAVAPFLYLGGLAPTMTITASANALTIKATQPGFTMLMPIWGATLNAPSASTSIPF
ncbi:TadE/TadG family type IV pilus assembly protein [uncultured Rhodoblastus sp.]|uniref:TadE/TadG family type IV pilus assembly protein n=1 Tax=uncultured Rhodoblastus sp. TaxID=543037 RepID=UPI0025FC52BF|nr:TadE/TadG family type IV pilus assembly protein [uncultured Rhodoblastus sp.]